MLKIDKMILSRFTLNGQTVPSDDPKVILQEIFTTTPNLDCWSPEALREFIVGSFEMVHDFGLQLKKELKESGSSHFGEVSKKFSRYSSWSSKSIKFLPRDRERLIHFIYDIIMTCEGMSLLPGFGMSNKHGDFLPGNPEKKSIYSLPVEIPRKGERNDDTVVPTPT